MNGCIKTVLHLALKRMYGALEMTTELSSYDLEQMRTFRSASEAMNIPYFKIQRAARAGLIPTYSILNSRKYVKISDILKAMSSSL